MNNNQNMEARSDNSLSNSYMYLYILQHCLNVTHGVLETWSTGWLALRTRNGKLKNSIIPGEL